MTERLRKAFAVQGMFILGYASIVFSLAISLLVIVWLYVREIRLQLLIAQRDIWKNIVEQHVDTRRGNTPKRNGTEE